MKLTKEIADSIRWSVYGVCGGQRIIRVSDWLWPGQHASSGGCNFLYYEPDSTLMDKRRLDDLVGTTITSIGGWVSLECYCNFLDGSSDGKVYLLLNRGKVVYVSEGHPGLLAEHIPVEVLASIEHIGGRSPEFANAPMPKAINPNQKPAPPKGPPRMVWDGGARRIREMES